MMLTTELRWIYQGTPPEKITHWFQYDCPGEYIGTPQTREDLYLYTPDSDYLNIKLRQERLEIKWRQVELGVVSFGSSWEGNLEKWDKCICEDLSARIPANAATTGTWVSIKKTRTQRTYQFIPGQSIKSVPVDRQIPQGCNIELTQLTLEDRDWWSFGLEAFGEESTLIENLQSTARLVSRSYPAEFQLSVGDSFAYPKLLSIAVQQDS